MKSTVSFMKSRCLCVKMVKTPHIHDSSYDHNKCPYFFPYGSHLLHNAFNQFRPFASSSSQAIPYPADFFSFHSISHAGCAKPQKAWGCIYLTASQIPFIRSQQVSIFSLMVVIFCIMRLTNFDHLLPAHLKQFPTEEEQ